MIDGFDNAPAYSPPIGAEPKAVTLVYPYYENPRFLAQQITGWQALPSGLREHVRLILVDDGSPIAPAEYILRAGVMPFETAHYRIDVDVRWNWIAARNIGMNHAPDGWCLMTDMDHVVPASTLHALIFGEYDPKVIYRLSRHEHTGEAIHPHPNTMFLTRETFWRVGGYDEALSGYYGTDDDWRRRCVKAAPIRTLPQHLVRHERQGDSSTIAYKRKQPEDAKGKAIIGSRRKGWRPEVLSFPYQKVAL